MQLLNVLAVIQKKLEEAGTQRALAQQLGISEQYLSDVIRCRRYPGKKVLDALNIVEVVTYEFKDTAYPYQ